MRLLLSALCMLGVLSLGIQYSDEALNDHLPWESLPGTDNILDNAYKQFTGYIDVDKASGKRIFYWFFEAESNPESAPVVLWTNGGPGCSGLLGLFTEMGPIRVGSDGKLFNNENGWTKLANMLFIEAPSGVGYSYSDSSSDYTTGDNQTAIDNYVFIQEWLNRFDVFRRNEFHITSESYGGHYMPTLASTILSRNGNDKYSKINFKGMAVGNPYTDDFTNNIASFDKYWGDQIVSKLDYEPWYKSCRTPSSRKLNSWKCNNLERVMESQISILNPYALDFPVCVSTAQRDALRDFRSPKTTEDIIVIEDEYDPCGENYLVKYLNRGDVRAALGVTKVNRWTECSYKVRYSSSDGLKAMQGYYPEILKADPNLKVLIYSGDDDSVCATAGTQEWIYDLGFTVDKLWSPWKVEGQIAGFKTSFTNNFAFVTVHYAGHEVPTYQPERALELFKRYLDGEWF